MDAKDVIEFWFKDSAQKWWVKDPDFDELIRNRFSSFMEAASSGELEPWRETAQGRVAEILLLDQFPRNAYRGTERAFATDRLALKRSEEMVALDLIRALPEEQKAFALMPFMHSESRAVHVRARELFERFAPANLDFEIQHKEIIDRFGRYPHRNEILLRKSTPEELSFLKTHTGF